MKNQKTTHNKKRNFVGLLTILMFIGLLAVAKNNWWGGPKGSSSSLLEGSATFDFEPFLKEDPHLSTSVKPNPSLKTTTWGRLKNN
ncbi:hypothetical protein H8D98_00680 [bacterium]|nr:hypothetical protein [bacterium]